MPKREAATQASTLAPRPSEPIAPAPSGDLVARLLYRDALMLIIDKPAGLPVHAGPGGGANLEQHLDELRFGLPQPPRLAHRLDRDTSGCLVLGRHRRALAKLGRLFAAGLVEKTYWAVVEGEPPQPEGRIDLRLRKVAQRTGWRMAVDSAGQPAVTDYRVLATVGGLSWLELHPRTGRTHQIRVHCAALGCPVLGETVYLRPTGTVARAPLHLHARAVSVPLYPRREPIDAAAPVPPHMADALRRLGFRETAGPPSPSSVVR